VSDRREFLGKIGVAAATLAGGAMTFDAAELAADTAPASGDWDLSWLDKLVTAKYRVTFNAGEIADGTAMDYAERFYNQFHEVHNTNDDDTRAVLVFRHLGTVMALNDAMWEKYGIGEDRKVNDPKTNAPAKRNIYREQIETLQRRGTIVLVCNLALQAWSRGVTHKASGDQSAVYEDGKANLLAGAILVPSGIYGLIRAQNAGCAYMRGS
jgi:intracellular sulfur oxidation DsrE/DsrF family protein